MFSLKNNSCKKVNYADKRLMEKSVNNYGFTPVVVYFKNITRYRKQLNAEIYSSVWKDVI